MLKFLTVTYCKSRLKNDNKLGVGEVLRASTTFWLIEVALDENIALEGLLGGGAHPNLVRGTNDIRRARAYRKNNCINY
jgi:hypothetical protein